jgi:TldD protein
VNVIKHAAASMVVAVDHGVRRVRRYGPDESPAPDEVRWRGTCLATVAPDGAGHAFSDGGDLLADVPGLSRDAVDAARRVLAHPPDAGRDDDPDELGAVAAGLAERHGLLLVHAEHWQRVAVGPPGRLTADERRLCTIEVIDAVHPSYVEVVQWAPGDQAGSRQRLEEAADAVRRTAALPHADLPGTRCDLVLDPGGAGPLFHELVGHPLEADAVAGGTSYLSNRQGEQVAPSWLMVTDGPAPAGEGLSVVVDDEGTPVLTTALVDRGRVAGPLRDRLTTISAAPVSAAGPDAAPGVTATGHGRRLNYRHPAVPRMWHTRASAAGVPPEEPAASTRLHARGLQLSWMNLLTGDAEFRCASGLLDTGDGRVRRTGPFTVSGNARDLLAALHPGPEGVRVAGSARRGCGKLGQFPLVTTFANAGLWIAGEAFVVRDDRGW